MQEYGDYEFHISALPSEDLGPWPCHEFRIMIDSSFFLENIDTRHGVCGCAGLK